MTKRIAIILAVVLAPLVIGLMFTYDVIKVDWVSMMEIQPSFRPQHDPLPLPARSIPIQGAAYVPGLGAPVNPVPADEVSLSRGKQLYKINCVMCHGLNGQGNGPLAAYFTVKPANLLQGNALTGSDGAIFITISNGVPGYMPALISSLPTPRERWDVVNYVRSLQKAGAK
jgi:mono/diheme cytochrome c family protein